MSHAKYTDILIDAPAWEALTADPDPGPVDKHAWRPSTACADARDARLRKRLDAHAERQGATVEALEAILRKRPPVKDRDVTEMVRKALHAARRVVEIRGIENPLEGSKAGVNLPTTNGEN